MADPCTVTSGEASAESVLQYEGWVSQFLINLMPQCHCEIQQPAQSWQGDWHTHILTLTFTPWNAHTLKISMLPVFFFMQQLAGFGCVSPLFLKALEFEHQSSAQLPRSPTIALHMKTVGQAGICERTRALRS